MRKEAQRRIPYATDTHPQADHATAVPLFFLQEAGLHCPIVRVAISGLSLEKHWEMGRVLAQTAKEEGGQTAFIASGDLSHVLKETGPYGYKKKAPPTMHRSCRICVQPIFLRYWIMTRAFLETRPNADTGRL